MAQERRAIAAAVLDSPELLMMHAQSTGDVSLPFALDCSDRDADPVTEHTGDPPPLYPYALRLRGRA